MASIVKKGYLDVKRKNKLGPAYKRKFVVLRRNQSEGTKLVEICDNSDGDREQIQLKGIWSVQDRESQSKKRFAFELVIGASVVTSFSCPSLLERDEWTESFRILNSISSSSPVPPIEDMYHVILEHNLYSAEIGMSGPCLLRVQDGSVVLYSEDGSRKLYHWSFDIIDNISMANDQVILDVHRPGNLDSSMQFTFNTDFDSSRNILIACSMMLESNKKKSSSVSLNNVGISVSPAETPTKTQSLSRSFMGSVKPSSKPSVVKEDKGVRRAKSFTDKSSFQIIRRSISPETGRNIGSIHSMTSQESYAINRSSINSRDDDKSPPPIPPRAPRRPPSIGFETVNQIDPDYHYIRDEDVIDGSIKPNRNSTQGESQGTLDQVLDDLMRDIVQENKIKQRKQIISPYAETTRKANTLGPQTRAIEDIEKKKHSYFEIYGDKGASDYLDPVPSKNITTNSPSRDWHRSNGIISKRHSSGEFNNTFHLPGEVPPGSGSGSSSSHDYHTIPDKPVPRHGYSSSMDSTHTESSVATSDKHSWLRTHSGSEEPPSPPLPPRPSYLTRYPSNGTPTKPPQLTMPSTNPNHSLPTALSSKKGDISPYATTKGIVGVTSDSSSSNSQPAPPLPPRSPSKHQRERVLSHSTSGSRCQKCNGVKAPSRSSSTVRQYHRVPPSPPSDTETQKEQVISPQSKPRPKSQPMMGGGDKENLSSPMYGYGNEIDSALAMLDDCLTGLNIIEADTTTSLSTTKTNESLLNTSPKSSTMIGTDIDKAIKSLQELGTDLSQHGNSQGFDFDTTTTTTPSIPPRSRVSLTQGGYQSTPKKHHLSQQYSNSSMWYGNIQNSAAARMMNHHHHAPLGKYHSTNEIPSSAVRAHDIHYN